MLNGIIGLGIDTTEDIQPDRIAQSIQYALYHGSRTIVGQWSLGKAIEVLTRIQDRSTKILMLLEEARADLELLHSTPEPSPDTPFEKLKKYKNHLKNLTFY